MICPERPPTGRVLVTDGHWNKTVAAVRALAAQGLTVTVGESTRLAAALFSRHAARRLRYPPPLAEPEKFVAAIIAELRSHSYDVLLPMELNTLLLLSKERHQFAGLVRFPFAPHATLLQGATKRGAVEAARRCDVAVPRTFFVDREARLETLIAEPGLPMVLKPDLGEGGRGLFYCRTEDELARRLQLIKRLGKPYLAQEWIPAGGEAIGVSVLMNEQSEPVARFTHCRVREYPVSGGPSTLRESCRRPAAEEAAVRLLKGLGWQGVAMVEFKTDPRNNRPLLMEINPRFWGSLPLAIRAGVDFPSLLYSQAMGSEPVKTVQRDGVRVRNLLPGELLYFLARRGRVGREFFDFRSAPDELFSLTDPGPFLARVLSPLAFLYDPQLRSVMQSRQDPTNNQ